MSKTGKVYYEKKLAGSLIRDILTYSELSKGSPAFQPVDLQAIVQNIQNEFYGHSRRGLDLPHRAAGSSHDSACRVRLLQLF